MNVLKVIHIKKTFLLSNHAEPAPPLGTILGNLGVNTIKFCEESTNLLITCSLISWLKL